MFKHALITVLFLTLAAGAAGTETLHATRVQARPSLDELAAGTPPRDMARAHGFIQRFPHDGPPISEETTAWVGYDDTNLYVLFDARDRSPEQIRARLVNRDLIPGDDDSVSVMIDTFFDQKRCYGFQANARGVQNDAIWTEGGTWDFSFDAVWHSEARITENGFVALITIPFKSLRFPRAEEQTWGILLYRGIPRKSEEAYWPAFSRKIAGRTNQAARLTGLTSVSPGRNAQLIPYTSFRDVRASGPSSQRTDIGVDGKLIIRDAIVADVTLNPDFGHIESDEPQETLTEQFEVFFPEKRPFFTENAGYFETPLTLLFTRRIHEPQYGLKVTGKMGKYSVGSLVSDDEGLPGGGRSAMFQVLRVSRDILADSSVGAMYVHRDDEGERNTVASADTRLRLSANWIAAVQGVISRTESPAAERQSGEALHLTLTGTGRNANYSMVATHRSPDFRAAAGFVPRVGITAVDNRLSYRFHPKDKRILAWGPDLITRSVWDYEGGFPAHSNVYKLTAELPRQTVISAACLAGKQLLLPREIPSLMSRTRVDEQRCGLELTTSAIPRTNAYLELVGGSLINYLSPMPYAASARTVTAIVEVHPTSSLTVRNTLIYTRLLEPAGGQAAFTHRLLRSKISYQFTRQLSVRTILTADRIGSGGEHAAISDSNRFNADFLVTYLLHPGTALHVGYNNNSEEEGELFPGLPGNDHRQLFAKVSYLLRF